MKDLSNKSNANVSAAEIPALVWQKYWAGSDRAKHGGGSFLVISNGTTWTARFDRNGKTEWTHSVMFKTADEAKAACERRRLLAD